MSSLRTEAHSCSAQLVHEPSADIFVSLVHKQADPEHEKVYETVGKFG